MGQEGLKAAALACLLLLAGCAAASAPAARPGAPPAPVFTAPQPAPVPTPPTTAPAPALPRDTCGLAALGDLVGKPRVEIPVPVDLSRRRVVCEGCPVTLDVRPDRQTIWYDQATGRITRLQCG